MRGDAVEKWLKGLRDQYRPVDWVDDVRGKRQIPNREYAALDEALDEYRLRADTGLTLADDIADAGEGGTDYATMVRRLDDTITDLRRRAQAACERPPATFHDERLGYRWRNVKTARVVCTCIHGLREFGGLCQDHGEKLNPDFTCGCPKPL